MTTEEAVRYIREHDLEEEFGEAIRSALFEDDESPRHLGNYVLNVFEDSIAHGKDAMWMAGNMFTMIVGSSLSTIARSICEEDKDDE